MADGPTGAMRPDLEARYLAAIHAVQSGVAWEMRLTVLRGATSPKHLRVGVDSALCGQSALIKLLVAKGLVTQDEIDRAIVAEVEAEVARYTARLSAALGRPVTLK